MACKWCKASRQLHESGLIKHDYDEGGSGEAPSNAEFEPTARVKAAVRASIDPVLRQALVDAGVLTAKDLSDAEAKIIANSTQPVPEVVRMSKASRPA